MEIVVNSGPLISLARIGQLHLLPALFGTVRIPAAVFREVTEAPGLPGASILKEADWLKVEEVSDRVAVERLAFWLDAGESEVLVLAQELDATAAIDEKRGRNIAAALDIPQTGTVGILLTAKRKGLIPALTPLLDQLIANGIRISLRLYEEVRQRAGEA